MPENSEKPVVLNTRSGPVYLLASKVAGAAPSDSPGVSIIFTISGGGIAVAATVSQIAQAFGWEQPKPAPLSLVAA